VAVLFVREGGIKFQRYKYPVELYNFLRRTPPLSPGKPMAKGNSGAGKDTPFLSMFLRDFRLTFNRKPG